MRVALRERLSGPGKTIESQSGAKYPLSCGEGHSGSNVFERANGITEFWVQVISFHGILETSLFPHRVVRHSVYSHVRYLF
jgi:hypothetical protein